VINGWVLRKGVWRHWLLCHDYSCAPTKIQNNCAETHPGSGVMSAFLPLMLSSTVIDSMWCVCVWLVLAAYKQPGTRLAVAKYELVDMLNYSQCESTAWGIILRGEFVLPVCWTRLNFLVKHKITKFTGLDVVWGWSCSQSQQCDGIFMLQSCVYWIHTGLGLKQVKGFKVTSCLLSHAAVWMKARPSL